MTAPTPHAVTGVTHFHVTDPPCLAPAFAPDGGYLLGLEGGTGTEAPAGLLGTEPEPAFEAA